MPKYRVELLSREHKGQRRSVTVCADSPDEAAAICEEREEEFAAFRLDEPETIEAYPQLSSDSLAIVEQTVQFHPQDAHLVDGRFIRAGKVTPSGAPGYATAHKGWRQFHEQEKPYKVHRVGDLAELMAVTGGQYGHAQIGQFDGTRTWDWNTDTIKTALTTSTYVPNIDADDTFSNVTNEITGTGYTAGGWTLTSATVTYDTATDQIRLDAADVSQASATFTARIAVTYKSTGTASTSPLICFLNFGADVSPSAGTFTITWDVTGIYVNDVT